MKILRIGICDGALGVAQAHELMQAVSSYDPMIVPELVKIAPKSSPDNFYPYAAAAQQALRNQAVDLCVHSLEALPIGLDKNFPIVAVSKRREPRDVLVCAANRKEPDLTRPLGAWEARRWAQLAKLYPGWTIVPAIGNIEHLLAGLDEGEFGALALSGPDIDLLGLSSRVHLVLAEEHIVTSCGQGIVAVQGRAGEKVSFLEKYHDVASWDMAIAEHSFAGVLLSESIQVFAARATIRNDNLNMRGMLVDQNGKQWLGVIGGSREDAAGLGAALAARIKLDSIDPNDRRDYRFKTKSFPS